MRLGVALERFTVQLEADGRSIHTRMQYARHINALVRWLGVEERSTQIEQISPETLAEFLVSSHARTTPRGLPKKPTSVNSMRTSLRCFFSFCEHAGYCTKNPARLIRRARCSGPPPRALSENEQERLLVVLREQDGGRDYTLFALMLATGIRVGSAVALRVEDVDLDAGELWLRRAKGGRCEKVLLGPAIGDHVRNYVEDRLDGPLFPGPNGGAIGVRHVNRRLKGWLQRAGIARSASAHALRHSFAQGLYDHTGDIALVQRALCHHSVASTMVYARPTDQTLALALASLPFGGSAPRSNSLG